ncbi:hypothetical protein ACFV80_16480 [Streptomyces sp. NPDC059862]|uniref:hypothetical protein n=1 Tax=Streptomyces sp. NPDC059862 TaxID=3346975 RepID=UPI0036629E0E
MAAFLNPIFDRLPNDGGLAARSDAARILGKVMPIALLVPINSRVARWTHDSVPADWKQQIGRWDRFPHVRVGRGRGTTTPRMPGGRG